MLIIKKIGAGLIVLFICFVILKGSEIHDAALKGNFDQVKTLITSNPGLLNIKGRSDKTPLHFAAQGGHGKIVEFLIVSGAEINCKNVAAETPLHYAAAMGRFKVVTFLIEKGADINSRTEEGLTSLDYAIDRGQDQVTRFLKSRGGIPSPVKDATIIRINKNIYKLTFFHIQPTNISVFIGSDSVLLIDTGFPRTAEKMWATLKQIIKGKIKYIINTHMHMDHTGGNNAFDQNVVIINYPNLEKLVAKGVLKKGAGEIKGKSGKIFKTYYTMFFNDREIRLIPSPGSHTDADMLIYFPKQGVLHMGDLLISQSFPSLTRGAKVFKYMEILDTIIDIFPENTICMAGHGRNLTMKELKDYRHMLLDTIEIVKKGKLKGKSIEQMQKEKVLKDFISYNTFIPELNTDFWIGAVFRSIDNQRIRDKP